MFSAMRMPIGIPGPPVGWCARQAASRVVARVDPGGFPMSSPQLPESVVMQLELFCAEETVRGYEQRIAAHAGRERIIRLATSRCENQGRRQAAQEIPFAGPIAAVVRWTSLLRCAAMPRRWNPCSALS